MVFKHVAEATGSLEKANANLQAELLSADAAKELLAAYARAEKLASFGKTVLARRVEDAAEVARATGTSVGKAKATVDTGQVLGDSDDVRDAFQTGNISLDQSSCRGAITFLLPTGSRGSPLMAPATRSITISATQMKLVPGRRTSCASAHSASSKRLELGS